MASLNLDAPGAYPETPANEEPRQQQQTQPGSSNLTQETPRSLGNDAHPSGHYFNDSGIYVDNSSLGNETTKPGVMTGAYSRVGAQDSAPKQNANYTYGDTSSTAQQPRVSGSKNLQQYNGGGLRPLHTPNPLDTPANTPAESNKTLGSKVNNTTTNTAPNNNTNNNTSNITSNTTSNTTSSAKDHVPHSGNKVQAGLHGKSSTEHSEPYWGSIPFGVGVYNGVAGHGSDEAPVTHHNESRNDRDGNQIANGGVYNGVAGHGSDASPVTHHKSPVEDPADNDTTISHSGIHNGVIGYGSKESTSPRTSKYDQYTTTDTPSSSSPSHQQRAFPLVNNGEAPTTGVKSNDADAKKRDSRFEEALAGATVAAAGGYAAHEYSSSKNDRANEGLAADDRKLKHKKSPSETAAALAYQNATPRDRASEIPATDNKRSKDYRPIEAAAAAAAPAYQYSQKDRTTESNAADAQKLKDERSSRAAVVDSRSHQDMGAAPATTRSEKNKSLMTEQPIHTANDDTKRKEDSNLGYYGAAAAAAGAGAYGMHKYANRDEAGEQSTAAAPTSPRDIGAGTRNKSQVPTSTTRTPATGTREEQPQYKNLSDGTASRIQRTNEPTSAQSQYRTLPDGTASGIATSREQPTTTRERQPQYNTLADSTASGIETNSKSTSGAQQPQYKTLSDGTTSGIDTNSPFNSTFSSGSLSQSQRRREALPDRTRGETSARSSSDSSHGGQYNVLSSGTPSGINLEHLQHHH
ncbi:hypothetical protein F5Y07DRAFT_365955 [Xylaria sp. FL0933]|nr:hypothetical protein F5Y07DRAFT_365955 [Xylaria sp. FL0933]